MRSRDHDTGGSVLLAHGIAQKGNRMQAVIDVDMDAVGGQDFCSYLCKCSAVVPAVKRHAYAAVSPRHILENVVGKPLGGHRHDIFVHAVGTDAHDAAESACPEFKVAVERILKPGRVSFHKSSDLVLGFLVIVSVKPALGDFSEIPFHNSIVLSIISNQVVPS